MSFLLKFLFAVFAFVSTSCGDGNTHKAIANVENTKPTIKKVDKVAPIDSVTHLKYSWKSEIDPANTIQSRFDLPEGYLRVQVEKGSFADWLRHLPLKEIDAKVHLYNGELKSNQSVHAGVVDIDVGSRDLQQCADAVMRLRSEYFYSLEAFSKIHFNYTSGDKVSFEDWSKGKKPKVDGNRVWFSNETGTVNHSYQNFKKYLVAVFSYAGTASLSKEMDPIALQDIQIGDVFIQGGFPGHAIIVVDMAINEQGEKVFLLAQSYMPAQEIHVLNNFNDDVLSPWYSIGFENELYSPEWTFSKSDLKRFQK